MNTKPALFDHRFFSIYFDLNTPPHRKFYLRKFNFLSMLARVFFSIFFFCNHIGRRLSAAFDRFSHHIYLLLSGHLFYANDFRLNFFRSSLHRFDGNFSNEFLSSIEYISKQIAALYYNRRLFLFVKLNQTFLY